MNFILNLNEKYDILDTLSESDKCAVFNAHSKINGDKIIVRVMYNAAAGALKALPQIRNPYVTQVLDVIQDGSDVVVIEKFIEGVTLRQYLDDGWNLTEAEIHTVFIQLCQALLAIHRESIIHRDIKPSNIIINNKNAVLIDFDVARRHDPQQSADTVYMGTKGYAAPEQYGFSQTDRRSDIYSLGVVIKELLGDRLNTAAYKDVVEKCTQFDPINRYQVPDEVLGDLRRFTIETPVNPPVSQTGNSCKNNKTVFKIASGISVFIFLTVMSFIFLSGIFASQAPIDDERTLETFISAYKEAGIVLKDEDVPFFQLIGAKNGIIFYIYGQKAAIYEFETENVLKSKALISNWPSNGKFALETSHEEAIEIFNNVAR